MKKVLLLAGPTAVGKTDISLKLAEMLQGEIICADSMQIYKEMTIGTAKPTAEELSRCQHHLFDFVSPDQKYSVSDYKRDATERILHLLKHHIQPIVTGGTGLYFNALMYQMDFSNQRPDTGLRDELTIYAQEKGREALYQRLIASDPERAKDVHPNNIHRVIRAIEIAELGTQKQHAFIELHQKNMDFDYELIVLDRDRDELYDRINLRVDLMIKDGLFDEVKSLMDKGLTATDQSMKGIGYKEIIAYYEGAIGYNETIERIKQNSRHYAKRQITWFKRYKNAKWFNLSKVDVYNGMFGDIISNI
jgi:tRNA dimethylallyltransferase